MDREIVRQVVEGEIDGVTFFFAMSMKRLASCIACSVKVEGEDELLDKCTNCGLMMKKKKCRKFMTARVVVDGKVPQ